MSVLCMSSNDPPGIVIENLSFEKVEKFKYLGVTVTNTNETVYTLCYTCIQFLIGDHGFAVIAAFSNLKYMHRITMWNNQK